MTDTTVLSSSVRSGDLPVLPGTAIADRYVLGDPIGSGASGVVYEARDRRLDRSVAVKVLGREPGAANARARLEREARAVAQLKSPHVVQVLDVCTTEAGLPCIVTELLEGNSLEQELNERGALSWEEALPWVLDVCDALAEAHAAGIVHRDVKPANLLLVAGPRRRIAKVLDFGISKLLPRGTDHTRTLTAEGTIVGTPAYMAPEQLTADGKVTPATDVWAIGVLMQEVLAGRRPFEAGSFPELCAKILEKRPAPFRPALGRPPPELAKIVARCLKRAPRQRFATARELGTAIERLLETHELITQAQVKGRGEWLRDTATFTSEQLPALPTRRANWLVLLLGGAGLGVLLLTIWAASMPAHGTVPESAPASATPPPRIALPSEAPPRGVPLAEVAPAASSSPAPSASASAVSGPRAKKPVPRSSPLTRPAPGRPPATLRRPPSPAATARLEVSPASASAPPSRFEQTR